MKKIYLLAALFGPLVTGCQLEPPKDLIGYLNVHTMLNLHGEQVQITSSGVVSPELQLSREEGTFRGWSHGQPIEMRVEGSVIKGSRGGVPIELHVAREGDAVVARGMYGSALADLAMCASASDPVAAPGEVKALSGTRPCILENRRTVVKMLKELGDEESMAMLVAAYYR